MLDKNHMNTGLATLKTGYRPPKTHPKFPLSANQYPTYGENGPFPNRVEVVHMGICTSAVLYMSLVLWRGCADGKERTMLYPTKDPHVFRAVILLSEDPTRRTEANVLVHLMPEGLEFEYVYHQISTRPYAKAPWEETERYNFPLNPSSVVAGRMVGHILDDLTGNITHRWRKVEEAGA